LSKNITIIGAGVAGISAALELAKAGYYVNIFEGRKFPGGRMYSFADNKSAEVIDNGQHLFSGAYKNFFALLNELGTSVYLKSTGRLKVHFANVGGKKFLLDTSLYPGILGIINGLFRFKGLSFSSKLQLIRFYGRVRQKTINANDLTCLELFSQEGQSSELIEVFWEPLIYATLNGNPSEVSAVLLIEVMERAFFAGGKDSELFLSVRNLSQLLNPFEKWLERHKGKITFQSRVESIIIEGNTAKGIVLQNGNKIYSDAVISTVQANILYNLLPKRVAEKDFQYLTKFTYSTIIDIYYWIDRNIKTADFTALIGTKSQWMFNLRNFITKQTAIDSEYPGLINITISGADELLGLSNEEIAAICFDELKSCLPEFAEIRILHTRVIKDKFATFRAIPAVEKLRPEPKCNVENLYIAGDWTNTHLPATLESAAISGINAAKSIYLQHE